jgi:hypothetical protein
MPDYGHNIEFGYFLVPIDEVAPDVQERVGAGRAHMLAAAEERPA